MGAAREDVWHVIKTYWPLLLGNALEWYEFTLFGYLSPYFQVNFFQGSAMAAWLGFAITFVARPLGGVVLGLIGDVFGRKVAAFLSIFGMLLSTVLQGCLPTYQSGPAAGFVGLCLLVVLRLLQGMFTGGEIATVSTYITEVGNPRSLASSLVMIPATASLGNLLSLLVTFSFEGALGDAAMTQWGWRLPFLLALLPGSLAIWGRRRLGETAMFLASEAEEQLETGKAKRAMIKIWELVASYWPQVLIGFGAVAALAVNLYGGMTWGLVSLKKHGLSIDFRTVAGATSNCVVLLLAPVVGCVADKHGAVWTQLITGVALAAVGMPLLISIEESVESPWLVVLFYGIGFGILQAFLMVHSLQVVELFPVEVRTAGMGLSYNVGFCLFGGFAPMVFEAAESLATWMPPLLLSLGGVVTASTTLVSLWLRSRGRIQLTHVRHTPYFYCCGKERFLNFQMQKSEEEIKAIEKKRSAIEGFQPVVDI